MAFNPDPPRDAHGRWGSGGGQENAYKDLTVNGILDGQGDPHKPGSRNNGEIAVELNARGQAALKALGVPSGVINPPGKKELANPKETNIVSSAIASEIERELGRQGGAKADDWYTQKFSEAMKVAGEMHPEMATNPSAKFGYTAALAITSQGETVPSNARLADAAYEHFAATGHFPTNVEASAQKMMNNNFEKLNSLIDSLGPKGAQAFLDKEFTVRELEKVSGLKIAGENKDTIVSGSAILGPKIGNGFYQNLNGNYKPLTADMWFMRAWGRLTGTLTAQVDPTKPRDRLVNALKADGQHVPKGDTALAAKADEILRAHEKDFKDNRADYDSGKKEKSEVVFAADRFDQALHGIQDQPSSGGQRAYMRDVFAQAQQKLADAGHKMTVADMQATWWYPEKRLYSIMGGRNSDRVNVDYASALRDLQTKKATLL